jgi:hypothetical protein
MSTVSIVDRIKIIPRPDDFLDRKLVTVIYNLTVTP